MKHGGSDIEARVEAMFERQMREWETVSRNYATLQSIDSRAIDLGGTRIVIQFNSGRKSSSCAVLDRETLASRKCFLCAENQPAEQESVDWLGKYRIEVNPYPIFPKHLTVSSKIHTPQAIEGRMHDMLMLADDLDGYVVFYNGAKCGASAPDHMHFQAGSKGVLPVAEEIDVAGGRKVAEDRSCRVSLIDTLCRRLFVVEAANAADAERGFACVEASLPKAEGDTEPMQNLLCWKEDGLFRLIVVPRKRHRPSFYGRGEGEFLLSPASVEMGGVVTTVTRRDFDMLSCDVVQNMFDEVCLSNVETEDVVRRMTLMKRS